MKLNLLTGVFAAALASSAAAKAQQSLNTDNERVSYSIGVNIGNAWKSRGIDDLNLDFVMKGIQEALQGKPLLLSDDDMNRILGDYQTQVRQRQAEMRRVEGEKNKAEGEKFLAENKTKTGVVTLPSGLQYKVLATGSGPTPGSNDTVSVHYRGTFINGTEFDSSYQRGEPATFNVNGVIAGWTEALQLMKVGSKWQLFVPFDLAYGEGGFGNRIGPNTALIFEVELLSTTPPPPTPAVTSDIIKVPSAEELKKGAKIEVIKPEELEKLKEKKE